eukprot:jgi/Picsp_1/2843/NSC_01069-R1_vacuolar-sorting protein snf8
MNNDEEEGRKARQRKILEEERRRKERIREIGKRHDEEIERKLEKQIATFKAGLEKFASEHKTEIQQHAGFSDQFYHLCAVMGVDPVLCGLSKGAGSNREEEEVYYSSLGVAVLDICSARSAFDGGLSDLDVVVEHIRKRIGSGGVESRGREHVSRGSGSRAVSKDDVKAAIKRLSILGNGLGIVTIGGKEFVKSLAAEFSTDCNVLLELFQKWQGRMTRRDAMDELRWSDQRVADAMTALVREGLVLIDDPGEAMPRLYWCLAVPYEVSLAL